MFLDHPLYSSGCQRHSVCASKPSGIGLSTHQLGSNTSANSCEDTLLRSPSGCHTQIPDRKPTAPCTYSLLLRYCLLKRLVEPRDRLMVELLWSTGLRVSELSRLDWEDVNLDDQYVVVRQSKTGKPRLAPLSARACRMIRRTPRCVDSLLGMSTQTIQRRLNRLGAPTAHAFRRGWAVHALESGVSQTSVQTAAGWSSGAMVSRYVMSASAKLALKEFALSNVTTRT